MSWANYLFPGVNKAGTVTRLAPSTDEEIAERISASTSSYTTESKEDTFKPDVIFESFHHQAKTSIPNRALLVGFLMLWFKQCVVLTHPHKVIVIDMVYPVVLVAHGKSIALFPAMVVGIQSGLQALTKSFCEVEAIVDVKGNPVKNSNDHPLVKTPSSKVELPYTYLISWYVMHFSSLINTVSASESFTPLCNGWRTLTGFTVTCSSSRRPF